jgi:hypothetical protein
MASSYLKEIVGKFIRDKEISLTDSEKKIIWTADRSLDKGDITLDEAMDSVREALHTAWKNRKAADQDFRDIEKQIKYKLG